MNQHLILHLEKRIKEKTGKSLFHIHNRPLTGGCINNGYEFVTDQQSFFVKTNSASLYPEMFEKEALGLLQLASTRTIRVPQVVCSGIFENTTYLVLEFISGSMKKSTYWSDFAQKLAMMHQHSNDTFGNNHDNYIGSLPQSNKLCKTWVEFYISQRIEPLVKLCVDNKLTDNTFAQQIEKFYQNLPLVVPEEKPALVHGDLWSGNVLTDEKGLVCLIDPAVYYGHREADLAFSTLFGAFPLEFYETYNEIYPLESGWRGRIDVFNLYPLLVHLILFGKSYSEQIKNIIKPFNSKFSS